MTDTQDRKENEHGETPENLDWKPYHRKGVECGWCDEWVAATTELGVHLRLQAEQAECLGA